MAEQLTSVFLKHSDLSPSEYVTYEACEIDYNGKVYQGCRSKDFLHEGETFYSYAKIYEMMTGGNLSEEITPLDSPKERIDFVCDVIKDFAGIDPHDYIAMNLTLDMVVLNTDRHFNNLGLIMDNQNRAKNAPIFDNGAAFLSNYQVNPPSLVVEDIDIHSNIFGKPFSPDLEYQAVSVGLAVRFDFDAIKKEIRTIPDIENQRIGKILLQQIERSEKIPELNIALLEKADYENSKTDKEESFDEYLDRVAPPTSPSDELSPPQEIELDRIR